MSIKQIMALAGEQDSNGLLRLAHALHQRQQIWEEWMGMEARGYMHLLSWQDGCLWVGVCSGAWAQRLRLQAAELTDKWNHTFPDERVDTLKTRIQPGLRRLLKYSGSHPAAAPRSTSPEAAQALRVAALMLDDQALAKAMQRLAKTLEA